MSHRSALNVMRSAALCNACFDDKTLGLERVSAGVPQPRWIGSRYWHVTPRVVLVLINPGQSVNEDWNQYEASVFRRFHSGGPYERLRSHFRRCASNGDRWLCRYRDLLQWDIEEIAQINMAWCATKGNSYPSKMLTECFKRHTSRLLNALEPHVVLLSGKSDLRDFKRVIEELRASVAVRVISHYARNALAADEAREIRRWLSDQATCLPTSAQ